MNLFTSGIIAYILVTRLCTVHPLFNTQPCPSHLILIIFLQNEFLNRYAGSGPLSVPVNARKNKKKKKKQYTPLGKKGCKNTEHM